MLPWEHAAIAYLLYSGYSQLRYGSAPGGWAVLVVLFASQFPDLIDKPLAWEFDLLPTGRSLGHSIFLGVPLSVAVIGFARRHDVPSLGSAFTIGYLSHLATDAVPLYPSSPTSFESVLWPVASYQPTYYPDGFLERTRTLLVGEYPSLLTSEPNTTVLIGVLIVGVMVAIWIIDGMPGLREIGLIVRWPFDVIWAVASR